jgi:hypothetical protein
MATSSWLLINAIRKTANNLSENKSKYMWGHMGSCNCGNLAQELTQFTREEIHEYAMMGRGDWREQLEEYCPTSGLPLDLLISDMLQKGLSTSDLQHLEWLSDPKVKARLSPEMRDALKHNVLEDVVLYLKTWADLLEEEVLSRISLSEALVPSEKDLA